MHKTKILVIAPYEELKNSLQLVSEEFDNIEVEIHIGDLLKGQTIAQERANDFDLIISRGGTAKLIRSVVDIPVIDIAISIYDVLGAVQLANNYKQKFAIVGYSSITETAHLLCDILGYRIPIYTIKTPDELFETLNKLTKNKYEMVLCDFITYTVASLYQINPILITSGPESIKKAFNEALTLSEHIQKVKRQNSILSEILNLKDVLFSIYDQNFQLIAHNLPDSLLDQVNQILMQKKTVDIDTIQPFYITDSDNIYQSTVHLIDENDMPFVVCITENSAPADTQKRIGIQYQSRKEIEDEASTRLLYSKFISNNVKEFLENINNHYQALIIYGEAGTAKSTIGYQAFLNQKSQNKALITINSKLINEKMWKYLVNHTNGPLVSNNNTLMFQNIEQMPDLDLEQLLMIIKETKVMQRNRIIFTINTQEKKSINVIEKISKELEAGKLYSPSLRERYNELNAITAILINRANFELNISIIGFEPKAFDEMMAFNWPGNLNQLQSAIKELVLSSTSHYITQHQFNQWKKKANIRYSIFAKPNSESSYTDNIDNPTLFDYCKEIILTTLKQNDDNYSKTSEQLGISRPTLYKYLGKK